MERGFVPHFLKTQGLELCVWESNPTGRRTVLLVHGHLDVAYSWTSLAEHFCRDGWRVLAPELRGHGDSGWVASGYRYHFFDFACDLIAIQEAFCRAPFLLVGHSLGGAIAAHSAGLMNVAPSHLVLIEGLAALRQPRGVEAARRIVTHTDAIRRFGGRRYPSPAEVAQRIRTADPECDGATAAALMKHAARSIQAADGSVAYVFKYDPLLLAPLASLPTIEEFAEHWSVARCRTLLLEGSRSSMRTTPAELDQHYGRVPRVSRVELEAGHAMARHHASRIYELIASFAGRAGPGRAYRRALPLPAPGLLKQSSPK
jgi:pimeloyl-ACP methyl ester carboxylesterase